RAEAAVGFGRIGRGEDLATIGRTRAPGVRIDGAADAGRRVARLFPVVRADLLLVVVAQVDEEVVTVAAAAERDVALRGLAVAGGIVAVVEARGAAVLRLLSDDVDAAGNRIGAVQRRSAVGQDLDAVHGAGRNGVEVDGGGYAG